MAFNFFEKKETQEPEIQTRAFQGKIFHLSEEGWGFIISDDIKFERIFFHWTGLVQNTLRFPALERGMRVEFEPKEDKEKGYRAIKIRVIE